MEKREWLILPRTAALEKHGDSFTVLLEMLNRAEEERGHRFTDEQAETIKRIITALIDNIRLLKSRGKQ